MHFSPNCELFEEDSLSVSDDNKPGVMSTGGRVDGWLMHGFLNAEVPVQRNNLEASERRVPLSSLCKNS